MNIQEYGEYQLRLINDLGSLKGNLAHMAMGVAGEGGEIVDIVKKHVAYDKPLDVDHLIEELGDALFYMNGLVAMIGASWDEVMRVNVAKLEARYPDAKFNADHAINRDVDAEQAAMKGQ
jgi:NTP pyrophosphatase (non-canonical NTP hydrolase)